MNTARKTLFKSSLLVLCLNASVSSGEVKMFDRPLPAEEMGNILFPIKNRCDLGMKTRTIVISNKAADSIGFPIKFQFNSAGILNESRSFLDEVGKMMTLEKFSQEKIVVEGHTDAHGSQKYNHLLSERRASAVKDYLLQNYQIPEGRLFVVAQGESKPLSGQSPFASVNRRVQFYRAP